jgi:putative tryptophan/tyrosine transport system substrate-binding protein
MTTQHLSPLTMLLSRHTRRREFLTLVGGVVAVWPLVARAQETRRARIGWFTVAPHPFIDGFRHGMRELGWIEGSNLLIEYSYAGGRRERLAELATALARGSNDLVVASGSDAVEAARSLIHSIPIVGVSTNVDLGGSLARPQGNLTGVALLFDELAAKWVELLVEAAPRAQRIGVIFDPSPSNAEQFVAVETSAAKLGKTILPLRIETAEAVRDALERARAERLDGLVFTSSPNFTANAERIVDLVQRTGLPAIYEARVLVDRGGLMSYGPNLNEIFRRVASYADRILNGAKPTDLPIERPTRFELVINARIARTLGLDLSPTLLLRADEVIE